MKNLSRIALFLLLIGQLQAQTIPASPVSSVSYDVEITTFKQVTNDADLNLLNDFEKVAFKLQKETKTVQKYLNSQNETTTVITSGTSTGFEGTSESPVKKIIMDKNGVFKYNAQNQALGSEAISPKEQAALNAVKQSMTPEKFETIPDFILPTAAMIQAAQTKGYQMTSTPTSFTVKNASEEYLYDNAKKLLQTKVFKDGKPFFMKQTFFTVNAAGQKVPSLKVETRYETSAAGALVEVVKVEKITNFVRTGR